MHVSNRSKIVVGFFEIFKIISYAVEKYLAILCARLHDSSNYFQRLRFDFYGAIIQLPAGAPSSRGVNRDRRFLRVNLSLQTEYQQNGEPLTD